MLWLQKKFMEILSVIVLWPYAALALSLILLISLFKRNSRGKLFGKEGPLEPDDIHIDDLPHDERIIIINTVFQEPLVQRVSDFQRDMGNQQNEILEQRPTGEFFLKGVLSVDVEKGKTYCVEKDSESGSKKKKLVKTSMFISPDITFG
jgi:hypothetical protein